MRRESQPGEVRYLQTSPEPHLKRLLSAGLPDVFSLGKAFRNGESGARHAPEFTMVEWYRRGWGWRQMAEETLEFCRSISGLSPGAWHSYRELFTSFVGLDPLAAPLDSLRSHPAVRDSGLRAEDLPQLPDVLDFLMSRVVEPSLDPESLVCVYDYPLVQAAQSRPHPDQDGVALRFEVFGRGMEIGNGYEELLDPREYRARFSLEQELRRESGKPVPDLDENFLSALDQGLPACSGVAVGWDRLLMIRAGVSSIEGVQLFPWVQA